MAFFTCFSCFKPVVEQDVYELDFAHCSLDDVPNDVFTYERTLEKLSLDCNNITDLPRSLFHCHGLKVLHLADNDIRSLPAAISSLDGLVELNISKNVLTDIPDSIKQCKHLRSLDASVNPLQKIPEGCTQLLSITELYLNDTFLEFLPANFGRLVKLKILELRENSLNTLPKSLNRLCNLERLDLGQNEISEVPEVIGSLVNLKELWIDGNRIKRVPPIIGNLTKLVHLELSLNHIDWISDAIGNCTELVDLGLSTNDLKELPESLCTLGNLVTLKVDDNQLTKLPANLGSLKTVEELFLSQNYLEVIPPSIGLCRKLHTLNVDDNDLEFLPKELGSCTGLRILSAHGNRLTTLPAELDHITNLAVINITANMIQHLPVSFMKLTKIHALWLSENQNKPLVQLNQDKDPITGQRVLTNFMLPQSQQQQDLDNISESGSFHASVWEEERLKKSMVKFSGNSSVATDKQGSLRREPTPFPKEMRAMAKRVQSLRTKSNGKPTTDVKPQPLPLAISNKEAEIQKREFEEYRPRMQRKEVVTAEEKEHQLKKFDEVLKNNQDSNDSGLITSTSPSPSSIPSLSEQRKPSDPLPQAPPTTTTTEVTQMLTPVPAEIITTELDDFNNTKKPPPYHIAAAMSKHAQDFNSIHRPSDDDNENSSNEPHYQNQNVNPVERNSSFHSDGTFESISESDLSTAPSSLQTIVQRVPPQQPLTQSRVSALDEEDEIKEEESGVASDVESVRTHANKLRKVSEQLLLQVGDIPRSRHSFTRQTSSSKIPLAFSSPRPVVELSGREHRPSSYAGPPNTVGLPPTPTPTPTPTPVAAQNNNNNEMNNGLLSTIEQATHSEDEDGEEVGFTQGILRPPGMTSRIPVVVSPKTTTAVVVTQQPNYENVTLKPAATASVMTSTPNNNNHIHSASKIPPSSTTKTTTPHRISTSQYVDKSSSSSSRIPSIANSTYVQMATPKRTLIPKVSPARPPNKSTHNNNNGYETIANSSKTPVTKIPTPKRN